MKVRLYCHHCKKQYSVAMEDIDLVKSFDAGHIIFSNYTYFYDGGCFFKTLNQYRRELKTMERTADE